MKAQIAIIAGGLAIAAGVAYAELKPANQAPTAPLTSQGVDQNTSAPAQDQQAQQPQSNSTTQGNSAPAQGGTKITNPNTKPKIPGGRGGDDEGGEGHEGGERHGLFGGDDD
jgi:hypothetical protein